MSLCTCPERATCQFQSCDVFADWSIMLPAWGSRPHGPKFACDWHKEQYCRAMTQRMPGLDPPPRADWDWRPSLRDMIRLADMEIRRQDQAKFDTIPVELERTARIARMTPAQRETLIRLRRMQR